MRSRGRASEKVLYHLSPNIMDSCRHWVQASWNHCWHLKHCSIFRYHLHRQHMNIGWQGTRIMRQSACLWLVALTLLGLHSNSNTAADWSDVGSPSPESPGRTVTPASLLTVLWLSDLSSERPLSVGRTDRWAVTQPFLELTLTSHPPHSVIGQQCEAE